MRHIAQRRKTDSTINGKVSSTAKLMSVTISDIITIASVATMNAVFKQQRQHFTLFYFLRVFYLAAKFDGMSDVVTVVEVAL